LSSLENFYRFHPSSNIDLIIREEVVPYVKAFSSLPPSVQEESKRRAGLESACEYYRNLKRAWLTHNELAYKIDRFLSFALDWRTLMIKPEYVDQARDLISEAFAAEDEKRIYSAGVKHSLDKALEKASTRYRLNAEEMQIVSTLCELSFWDSWTKAHIEFVLASRGISLFSGKNLMETTLELFHGNSHAVLKGRLQSPQLKKIDSLSTTELLKRHEEIVSISMKLADKRIKLQYLAIGRSDITAIQGLLRYDNLTEYLFGYSLFGFPDLLLRKALVNRMVADGKLDRRASILFYTLRDFQNIKDGTHSVSC
jgi:hypothetical protein